MNENFAVPTDALVIVVGGSGTGKTTFLLREFGREAIVASDHCRMLICGDETRQDINKEAFELFHGIIDTRLRLGVLTVADATNVTPKARRSLENIANKHRRPVVKIFMQIPLGTAMKQNSQRDRKVPDFVVERHHKQFGESLGEYNPKKDHLINWPFTNSISVERNLNIHVADRWIVIGDIHGCYAEFVALLKLFPENTRLCFVGDFVDRGPDSKAVLNHVERMIAKGTAVAVQANHDNKLYRAKVLNRNVKMNPMLEETMAQVSPEDLHFLDTLPYQVHLQQTGDPRVCTVVHGALSYNDRGVNGLRAVEAMCLYGETDGTKNPQGFPNRTYNWVDTWLDTDDMCVIGHTPVNEVTTYGAGNVINIDTGCAFGGKLTGYDPWTDRRFAVQSFATYEERVPHV